jgi:hypothetical protein
LICKNSYYGCVLCGNGLIEFEHIIPQWSNATKHDPEKMALLCRNHHGEVTNGSLSKDKVFSGLLNPYNKQNPARRELSQFQPSSGIDISLSSNYCFNVQNVFVINKINILGIQLTDNIYKQYVINCEIFDNKEELIFQIKENELIIYDMKNFSGLLYKKIIKIVIKDVFKIEIDLTANNNREIGERDLLKITKFYFKNNGFTYKLSRDGVLESLPYNAQINGNIITNCQNAFTFEANNSLSIG